MPNSLSRNPRSAHPSLTRRSPWLTLLARCECLKRHGVSEHEGELGADFSSIVLPKKIPRPTTYNVFRIPIINFLIPPRPGTVSRSSIISLSKSASPQLVARRLNQTIRHLIHSFREAPNHHVPCSRGPKVWIKGDRRGWVHSPASADFFRILAAAAADRVLWSFVEICLERRLYSRWTQCRVVFLCTKLAALMADVADSKRSRCWSLGKEPVDFLPSNTVDRQTTMSHRGLAYRKFLRAYISFQTERKGHG